ncbi:MAG: cytochrome c [candidate division WOR-3 bacterium]
MKLELLNILVYSLPLIYLLVFLSYFLFIYYIFDKKRIFLNTFFELIIFFIPLLILIVILYVLTGYKNPYFSFAFIFYIFSYISISFKVLYNRNFSFILFLFSLFFFSSSITLYLDSEKMLFVKSLGDILYSFNVFAKFFSIFIFLSLLYSFFKIKKKMFYFFLFLSPIFYFWDTITLPDVSLIKPYFYLSIIFLFSLYLLVLNLNKQNNKIKFLFIFLLTLPLFISRDLEVFYFVNKEKFFLKSEELKALEPEEKIIEKKGIEGKKVFDDFCTSCHSFEQKVVGPPFKEVLPKYKRDLAKLKSFIKNPSKINPLYPPMPNLGLKDKEIDAVIEYLMEELKKYE